jgi:hypothetical protein
LLLYRAAGDVFIHTKCRFISNACTVVAVVAEGRDADKWSVLVFVFVDFVAGAGAWMP